MCVITPPSSCALSGSPYSAAQARRFVEGAMCREHAQQVSGDAILLASELVAHSLTTGTRPTTLSIDCQVSRLEISLGASGHQLENAGAYPRLRTFLIEQLASGWGVDDIGHACTYWCVLGTRVAVAAPQSP